MSSPTILLFHDMRPAISPLRGLLTRLLGADAISIDAGRRMKPLASVALAREIAAASPHRVFLARNALLIRPGSGMEHVRSLAPVSHPILQVCRSFLQSAIQKEKADQKTEAAALPQESAVTARLVASLEAERPAYPFASLQTGLYLASRPVSPGAPSLQRSRALTATDRLGAPVTPILADFPDLLRAAVETALGKAGIEVAKGPPVEKSGTEDLANDVLAWQSRLPRELFSRLCAMNLADLLLLDTVADRHGALMGLTSAQRSHVAEALGRAAEITKHRHRAPRPGRRTARPGEAAEAPGQAPGPPSDRPEELGAATGMAAARVAGTIEPDDLLGWRNRANARFAMNVLGRRIVHDTDDRGCRVVVGQPATGERTFSLYGCSNVFGWGVLAQETFASVLQARHPSWRVENFGVNGYGAIHALLALQRDLRWAKPDYVALSWSDADRVRNVAAPAFVRARTASGGAPRSGPMSYTPRACLDESGKLLFKATAIPRPDLVDIDLSDFAPDPYYMELISFKLIRRAAEIVRDVGGYFFIIVIRGKLSALIERWLADADIPVVATPPLTRELTNLPDDSHANAAGHILIADHIDAHLSTPPAQPSFPTALRPSAPPSPPAAAAARST